MADPIQEHEESAAIDHAKSQVKAAMMFLGMGVVFGVITGVVVVSIGSAPDGRFSLIGGAIVGLLASVTFAMMLIGSIWLALSGTVMPSGELRGRMRSLQHQVGQMEAVGNMSDMGRRILARKRERDLLRDAIIEDINSEDYESAQAMMNTLARAYGYAEEAEKFRKEITDGLRQRQERIMEQAVERVDQLCRDHDWEGAEHEVRRFQSLFPDAPHIGGLRQRISIAYDNFKRDLERRFLDAAARENMDEAMELMVQVDNHLSDEQVERLRKTARTIIQREKENLAVRFKLSVHDHDWKDALLAGEKIIREFPNTRMAQEVREMLVVLRKRAEQQQETTATKQAG